MTVHELWCINSCLVALTVLGLLPHSWQWSRHELRHHISHLHISSGLETDKNNQEWVFVPIHNSLWFTLLQLIDLFSVPRVLGGIRYRKMFLLLIVIIIIKLKSLQLAFSWVVWSWWAEPSVCPSSLAIAHWSGSVAGLWWCSELLSHLCPPQITELMSADE